MRILICEDTADIAVWLAKALSMMDAAYDARIKVAGFEDLLQPEAWHSIDVAIIDAMLPDVYGVDIARYVRTNHPRIKVILATASLPSAEEGTGIAHHVLLKPFTTPELIKAIES